MRERERGERERERERGSERGGVREAVISNYADQKARRRKGETE